MRRALKNGGAAGERVPVKLNRNLLNFPLARDMRTKAEWWQGSETGRWMADLPGEGRETHRIRLILPAHADAVTRRCPTALDMNVLFQLIAEAQRQKGKMYIEFPSLADLLRRLRLTPRDRERARVESSLLYWTRLSIRWSHWYQDGNHVELSLPPPLEEAKRAAEGNGILITLHRDWLRVVRIEGYYERVSLPLPPEAAVQNLILLVLTQDAAATGFDPAVAGVDSYFDYMAPLTKGMDRWWLGRKLGLLHKQRNRVINRAIQQASAWFADRGGKLKLVTELGDNEDTPSGQIAFRYARPPVPRFKSSMGRSRGPLPTVGRELNRPQDTVFNYQNDEEDEFFSWRAEKQSEWGRE